MTTGPIYLVSACATPDEFVAAFRRYADRGSLFVPIAEPLPPGRRGRLAITLADGGVMLDGECEIVASSKTASVLHGRIGMTIRFTEPDESSKSLLGELDKARVAIKLAAVSIKPRPAPDVPEKPRPVPPSPAGRIDAANALAECVAIGDLTQLREGSRPNKPSGKLPAIPSGKVPTIPPKFAATQAMEPLTKLPSKPFRLPTPPPVEVVRAKPPTEPPPIEEPANIVDRPPPRLPTHVTQASAVVPPPSGLAPPPAKRPPPVERKTSLGMQAVTKTPPMPMPAVSIAALAEAADETTDVADLAEVRSTAPGLGVPPAHDTELMVARTMTPAAITPPPVEPDGDWTMTPDAEAPTPVAADRPPPGPMTGNWTIALTPDGWSEPEKIAASLPTPGLPTMVSGEKAMSAAAERSVDADEGKIQVDPTLMEPLTPMPEIDSEPVPPKGTGSPGSSLAYPLASPMLMAYAAPPPLPTEFERAPDPTSLVDIGPRKSRKGMIIGIAAVVVVGGGIAAVRATRGGGGEKAVVAKPADAPVKIALTDPIDAAVVIDAEVVVPVDAPVVVESTDCTVEIQSVPKDVEIDVDNTTQIGTAPGKVKLPCGTEVKLFFRKGGYGGAIKTITPTADMKPIKVALAKAQYLVKVSSAPAGATITVGGKSAGFTPSIVHVDGNQPAVITIAKNGYEPVEQKVSAKATAQVVHVKLVPKKRSR